MDIKNVIDALLHMIVTYTGCDSQPFKFGSKY